MARAYICLARNDVEDNFLQVLDLKPNSSQMGIYDRMGQTGYITWAPQNDTVVLTDPGGNVHALDGDCKGLAAYMIDNVEDHAAGGDHALTVAKAALIAADILTRVAAGQALALANLNTIIAARASVGSDLTGVGTNSRGSVEHVLRILSGEVYLVPDGTQVADADAHAAGKFPVHAFVNRFVTSASSDWRNFRPFVETGVMHASALTGALSKFGSGSWEFLNPLFTYGAAGTALTYSGAHIGATGQARALAVYDHEGGVIV